MPNWCKNCLIVKGQKEEVQEFINKAEGIIHYEGDELKEEPVKSPLVFSNFYPIPKELLERASHDNAWYLWAMENWGCKWDPAHVELEITTLDENLGIATYHFFTPWSPPLAFVRKISQDMPELDFLLTYSDCSVGFYGTLNIIEGKVVVDKRYSD